MGQLEIDSRVYNLAEEIQKAGISFMNINYRDPEKEDKVYIQFDVIQSLLRFMSIIGDIKDLNSFDEWEFLKKVEGKGGEFVYQNNFCGSQLVLKDFPGDFPEDMYRRPYVQMDMASNMWFPSKYLLLIEKKMREFNENAEANNQKEPLDWTTRPGFLPNNHPK